jgi:transcription antitermination factor NusG
MSQAGFAVFVPAKTEWRFANEIARGRKKKTEQSFPLMPRYVFLGMNDTWTPGWYGVVRFNVVTSIIGFGGIPYEIPNKPIWDLMRKHNSGRFRAPRAHRFMQTSREFEVGDQIITEDGLFEGKVTEIKPPMARIFVDILGGYHEINVHLDRLVAA